MLGRMTLSKRLSLTLVLAAALLPVTALADFTLSASVGKAFRLSPAVRGEPTTLMVAPGFGFADLLRLEVGFAVSMPDIAGGLTQNVDVQIRPAVVVAPPAFPLYFRAFAVVDRIIQGVRLLPGAAVGVSFGVADLSIFIEAGALPRFTAGGTEFLLEPRAGLGWGF